MRLPTWVQTLARGDVIRDLHVYGGLVLVGFGGWKISPRWTLIALGVALIALGLLVPLFRRRAS